MAPFRCTNVFIDIKRLLRDIFQLSRLFLRSIVEKRASVYGSRGIYERVAFRITSPDNFKHFILVWQTFIRKHRRDLPKPSPSRTDDKRSLNLGLGDDSRRPEKTSRGLNARKTPRRYPGTVAFNLISPRVYLSETYLSYRVHVVATRLLR